MSPYFATEKDCDDFHYYFTTNCKKYELSHETYSQIQYLNCTEDNMRRDLRSYEMGEACKIGHDFVRDNPSVQGVVFAPRDETLYEFYGCDMEEKVGYDAFSEEEEDEDEEEEDEEEA